MPKVVYFLLFFFTASSVFAAGSQRRSSVKANSLDVVLELGLGVVGEKQNNNQVFDFLFMPAIRGGVDFGSHEALLELSGFQSSSGASGVEVKRLHEQIDVWYRYLFFAGNPIGTPFAGLALGFQRDEVETDYFSQTQKDVGQFEVQFSAVGGYRFSVLKPFTFGGELRLATSNNYNPRVMPSVLFTAGAVF